MHPPPVFWSGEFHGMCSPWGHKESEKSEWLSLSLLVDSWPLFFFFKYKFIYFNWRLITLQYCIGFAIHQHESAF